MAGTRRDFLRASGLLAGAAILSGDVVAPTRAVAGPARPRRPRGGRLALSFRPYTIEMKHVFTIAGSSRSTTPVMLTEIEWDGIVGHGEASMPPYLGESHRTAEGFLSKLDLGRFSDPFQLEAILAYVDGVAPGNPAAKASIDIALHDLVGKLLGQPWWRIWGLDLAKVPPTSYTIGIDKPDVVRQKTKEASEFKILKVKLGRDTDRQMIETIRSVTSVPICADANQGWKDRQVALDMIHWLKERGVVFVEQPLPKERVDDMAWLTSRSPLPIIGDEAVQRLPDVHKAHGVYSGINIKLMKATGLREAYRMATVARALGMRVMVGCMTETSCAISAAAQLAPMADWADLDGALLIGNDPFEGARFVEGRTVPGVEAGVGVHKRARPAAPGK